jgi:hypothetical protein
MVPVAGRAPATHALELRTWLLRVFALRRKNKALKQTVS